MKQPLRIGYNSKNYGARRLILKKIENAVYKDVRFLNFYFWRNIFWVVLKVLNISPLSNDKQYQKLFSRFKKITLFKTKIDIVHLFNSVNTAPKVPWVLTVEAFIPYNTDLLKILESSEPNFGEIAKNKKITKTMELLADDNCRGILPFSQCTYDIQMELVSSFPKYANKIKNKMLVLHPPQNLLISDVSEKGVTYSHDDQLKFIFIGKHFYRKGGIQMLKAFEFFKKNENFELIIISELTKKDNNFEFATEENIKNTMQYVNDNSEWITHYSYLPNDEVLNLIKSSHIGLLPTWADTYGYSVLECQAGGCPVITTSVRALSEINSNELGWVIDVPTNRLNHPQFYSKEDFNEFAKILESGLIEILEDIFKNKMNVKKKAETSLNKIRLEHNPKGYAEIIKNIYKGKLVNKVFE